MKKFFSALLTILMISAGAYYIYTHPAFFARQVDKVRAVYYVHKGDKELRKYKFQKAINYYNRAVNLYPEHYGAWYNLGNIYVVYEDYYSAVDSYEQAFEHNPKMMVARMNYGIVSAEKLGDFDGAIDQYNEILETKRHLLSIPFVYSNRKSYKMNKGLAFYNKGVAYKQKSVYLDYDYEYRRQFLLKALEAYKEACKILKNDYDARYNLALTQHLLGEYRDAGLSYCRAIELGPMNYEAHYNLAVLLRHLKFYNESLDELRKASTLVSNSKTRNASRERYIFDVLNEVTRTVLANADNELVDKMDENTDEHTQITYVNGRLVFSDELDKMILKNFKICGAKKLIKEEFDEDIERYDVHIPDETY